MNKERTLSRLDDASTVAWFIMDACWMNGHVEVAKFLGGISAFLMIVVIRSMIWSDVKRVLPYVTALCWLLMNASWMLSEKEASYIVVREVFMWLGITLLAIMAIFSKDSMIIFRRFRIRRS